MARPKIPVPLSSIEEEFRAQLKFLKGSCLAYDQGDRDEFRRIALSIRILVYDHRQSKSVCSQLGIKSVLFRTSAEPINPKNLLSEASLVMMVFGPDGASYAPVLYRSPFKERSLSFDDWWNEEVFRSPGGVSMARSGFVLHTANQAGGAHVDAEIDEDFHKIARENEAGWIAFSGHPQNPISKMPLENLEKACIRQIGFEVLSTLEPEWKRIEGNRVCDCGSGRKYRYCHGKP